MSPRRKHADAVLWPEAGFETICQHYAENRLAHDGAAAPPLYQSSTFVYPNAEAFIGRKAPDAPYYEYTRVGNPTVEMLEAKLARLEAADWARGVGSGMAAVAAAINACVQAGDHVVCVSRVYWPTRVYLGRMERYGVQTTYVRGVDPADFAAALRPETKLLYLESPTSGIADVPPVRELVALAGERGIKVVLDNSWATPFFYRPLDDGVDLVLHSATKYFGGHSDVVAGVVMGHDADLRQRVLDEAEFTGGTLDPFAAWLLLRGLRTLGLRMERHQSNGLAVARTLDQHPKVKHVFHPGLPSHPHHTQAARQLRGFGSLFGFMLREQTREACYRFIDRLKLFSIGVSWGGHESLVLGGDFFSEDPASPVWFIRLHVGLESEADLVADVLQALED